MVERFQGKYRIASTRLPNWNYAADGAYFVTICTHNRLHFFGDVINSQVQLSVIGKIADQFWADIPNHFADVYLDAYVIMPNHVHGILIIDRSHNYHTPLPPTHVETLHATSLPPNMSNISPKTNSLGAIIRSYKSAVTRWSRQNHFDNFAWQPRFYEHIIRNDSSMHRIRNYIINNPAKWQEDKHNLVNLWM